VDPIVEKTADAGRSDAGGLGFEVENLADDSAVMDVMPSKATALRRWRMIVRSEAAI
jgi:hypothetical protein